MARVGDGSLYRHVLLVPCVGEGHINGLLNFALLLAAQAGLLISFAYPARAHSLALVRSSPLFRRASLLASLRLHVVEDGLPSAEHESPSRLQLQASSALILDAVEALLRQHLPAVQECSSCGDGGADGLMNLQCSSCDNGASAVDGLDEKGSSPVSVPPWPPVSCIISDTFMPGAQDLAQKFGIPRVDMWTSNGTCYSMCVHLPEIIAKGLLPLPDAQGKSWMKVEEAPLVDFIPGLPAFRLMELPMELLQVSDLSHIVFQFIIKAFSRASRQAHWILVNSVYELESHAYDAMQALGFPFFPVGPLLDTFLDPAANQHTAAATAAMQLANRDACLLWLDQQVPHSVVYIALGTTGMLSSQEMQAMALGLEASSRPFLWVIRLNSLPPAAATAAASAAAGATGFLDSLPIGFMERTVARGRAAIVTWAPQVEVLRHPAVAAFLSHCGWNSTLESLWEGVPLVACPRSAEQRCNAKAITEDWKVGVEMEREDDGSFTAEAVHRAVEGVVGNPVLKERALHFKQMVRNSMVPDGTSHANIMSFVDYLLHLPIPK